MDQQTFYELITKALKHPTSEATIDFLYEHGVADIRIMTQGAGSPLLWQDETNGMWYTESNIDHMASIDGTVVLLFPSGQSLPSIKGVDLSKFDKNGNANTAILSPVAGSPLQASQPLREKR